MNIIECCYCIDAILKIISNTSFRYNKNQGLESLVLDDLIKP